MADNQTVAPIDIQVVTDRVDRMMDDEDPISPIPHNNDAVNSDNDGSQSQEEEQVNTNCWAQNEREMNRRYIDGEMSLYSRSDTDDIRSRGEVLAQLSGEAAQFLLDMHATCFIELPNMTYMMKAEAILQKSPEEIALCDETTLNHLFHTQIDLVAKAVKDIEADETIQADKRKEIYSAAKGITMVIMHLNDLMIIINKLKNSVNACASGKIQSDIEASWRYKSHIDGESENKLQQLYNLAYKKAHKLGYARYKDCFMKRIITKDGLMTNAWERVSTFQEFVYDMTKEPDGLIQYLSSVSTTIMDSVAELLGKKREPTVPWLIPDRHVFAFRNGCYLAKEEMMITFSKNSPPMMPNGTPCPTACKYHDCEIKPEWITCPDCMTIPTPLMNKIMKDQKLSKDVKRTYFAMLGRGLYDLGELDNWQVFLFIKGQAETGKSTLLKFVANFYNSEDIGILSNNIEGTFGASMIAEKFLVIGDDLGENFSLDQQLFQNMTSGNEVSLPRKNKAALITKWISQLMLSGNVLPDYKDNSGSFSRRLLIIHYSKPVSAVDPTIPERLKAEAGAAIIKCNRAYRNMVRRLSALMLQSPPIPFWNAVPEEFRVQKRNVMQSSNAYFAYFSSGQLVFGPGLFMPKHIFVNQLMAFCQANAIPRPRFIPSQYEGAMAIRGLRVTKNQTRVYPRTEKGEQRTMQWIVGCDMATGEAIATATADHIRAAESVVDDFVNNPQAAAVQANKNLNGHAPVANVTTRKRPAPTPLVGEPPAQRPRI